MSDNKGRITIDGAARGMDKPVFAFDITIADVPEEKSSQVVEAVQQYLRKTFGLAGKTNGGSFPIAASDNRDTTLFAFVAEWPEMRERDKGKADHMLALFLQAGQDVANYEEGKFKPKLLPRRRLPQTFDALKQGIAAAVDGALNPQPSFIARLLHLGSPAP